MHNDQRPDSEAILTALLWCCVLVTGYYFFDRIISQEQFGFHDWYLFIGHAKQFTLSGVLYDRDLSHYEPSAAIYKFPPLFASTLVFLLECGLSESAVHQLTKIIYFGCYFFSFIVLLKLPQIRNRSRLIPVALIILFSFETFFDNYNSAQMEVYVLLMLSLSLLYLARERDMLSGIFIGIATAIKIYPIYFSGYYFARKKYSALAGVALGFSMVTLFSLVMTGWIEHVFYFSKILPTLLTEHISGKGENLSLGRLLLSMGWSMNTSELLCLIILLSPIVILFIQTRLNHTIKTYSYNMIWFSIFVTTFLFATKNSWWNYQLLLVIPLLIILGSLSQRKISFCFIITILITAYLLIFWCNLGKLDTLIIFFTNVLDASPLLTHIMLKINLLRGIATFLILVALIFSLVENQRST